MCALQTKDLSNYAKRGNVVVRDDGQIDTLEDKNRAFLQKRHAKMDKALADPEIINDTPKAHTRMKQILSGNTEDDYDADGIMSVTASEKKYKHFLAVKTERAAELDRLKIEKAKGIMVPSELIQPVLLQHNQSITTAFKNGGEELLRMISKKRGLTGAELAYYRGEFVQIINTAIANATSASVAAVKNIISEHSERRGVGERG